MMEVGIFDFKLRWQNLNKFRANNITKELKKHLQVFL